MHHYPFNVGDYIKDTVHLSLMQHGAYRRLLDWYYSSEKPLPNDLTFLARVCGAQTTQEKKSVEDVLPMFFTLNEQTWNHKRVDKELSKYRAKSKAGTAGMDSRYQTNNRASNEADNIIANRSGNKHDKNQYAHGNHEPITKNQEPLLMLEADASEPELMELGWSQDRGWVGVTATMIEEWQIAYPACEASIQLAAMDQWLKANPLKSKKKQWLKFVIGWMSRSQERGGDLVGRNPMSSSQGFSPQKKEGGGAMLDMPESRGVEAPEEWESAMTELWGDDWQTVYAAWELMPQADQRQVRAWLKNEKEKGVDVL